MRPRWRFSILHGDRIIQTHTLDTVTIHRTSSCPLDLRFPLAPSVSVEAPTRSQLASATCLCPCPMPSLRSSRPPPPPAAG
eukprot:3074198-Rhodomonas_salina.1